MKVTEVVRQYAATLSIPEVEAITRGMEEKSIPLVVIGVTFSAES